MSAGISKTLVSSYFTHHQEGRAENESQSCKSSLTLEQEHLCLENIHSAGKCPFTLGVAQALGPSRFLAIQMEEDTPLIEWKAKNKALIFHKGSFTHGTLCFKVIKAKEQGFAHIYYSGLNPLYGSLRSFATTVPIDKKLLGYVSRIFRGDFCGLFGKEGENNSTQFALI